MIKIINETNQAEIKNNKRKNLKENLKEGAISNADFFEIFERLLRIMKVLEVTNSFTIDSANIIFAQIRLMRDAVEEIEKKIDEHLDIKSYINK